MKTLIIKVLVFIMILWILDFVLGGAIENMYFSIETGTSGAMINHLTKNEYEVYIMGASAAQHGYIPNVIGKEIGMSVYNTGEDGTSIFYKYAVLQLILKHAKPRVIIWDVLDLDYYYFENYVKSNLLRPYHHDQVIFKLLVELDPINMAVKASRIFPFNQKIASIIIESFRDDSHNQKSYNGFLPLIGDMKEANDYATDLSKVDERQVSSNGDKNMLTRKYFDLFIDECRENNIKLIAFTSPRFPAKRSRALISTITRELSDALQTRGISLYEILPSKYPQFNRSDLYKDRNHLNLTGAHIMSLLAANIVKDEITSKYR